jgi:hypothetical protein
MTVTVGRGMAVASYVAVGTTEGIVVAVAEMGVGATTTTVVGDTTGDEEQATAMEPMMPNTIK